MQISTLVRFVTRFPVVLCLLAHSIPVAQAEGLFGASETSSSAIGTFPKWTGVVGRYEADRAKAEAACEKSGGQCPLREWQEAIQGFQGQSGRALLNAVNDYINRHNYILDMVNWGMEDYWATPLQFFAKNGDCEDYAIAKYRSLKELGVSTASMRIVILNDQNLGIMHAVLAVEMDGTFYILDNQVSQVLEHTQIKHYQPIYSINEDTWWRHTP